MGTAIKHPVPDRVKPSFVIFDIQALWRSGLSVMSRSTHYMSFQRRSSQPMGHF